MKTIEAHYVPTRRGLAFVAALRAIAVARIPQVRDDVWQDLGGEA